MTDPVPRNTVDALRWPLPASMLAGLFVQAPAAPLANPSEVAP